MELLLTSSLNIRTKSGALLELMPVVMTTMPSSNPATFVNFLKTGGSRIEIDEAVADKIQRYMTKHRTEALSTDGLIAFTIAGTALVECNPDIANSLFDQGESEQ